MEDKKTRNHNVVMENREKAIITGVIDIHSFDDELILAETDEGILTLKGNDLKMNKLNLENNELIVEGKILALIYSESSNEKKSGMFGKIFK
ncbi:MAG: sporulation protein YabP [Clostridia bacterium]|nr:sporulation protein YabP [Clostridia bacterium]